MTATLAYLRRRALPGLHRANRRSAMARGGCPPHAIAYLDIRDRLLPHTRKQARDAIRVRAHPMLRNLVVELTLRAPAGWRHAAAPRARGRDSNGAGRGNERSRPHAMTIPLDDQGCPDLQALVRLRGKQYADSIGEKYDPEHCPRHAHIGALSVSGALSQPSISNLAKENPGTTARWKMPGLIPSPHLQANAAGTRLARQSASRPCRCTTSDRDDAMRSNTPGGTYGCKAGPDAPLVCSTSGEYTRAA